MAATNVRLVPQSGLSTDHVVTLSQIIRNASTNIQFGVYEGAMQIALGSLTPSGWNGTASYDLLASSTENFVRAQSEFPVSSVGGFPPLGQEDADEVNRRFQDNAATPAVTLGSLDTSARTLDEEPDAGGTHVAPDQGVLKITQTRANQQIGSASEIITSSGSINGILDSRLRANRCIELIWSYWMEQAMLVQGMNAIAMRYQNRRPVGRDGLIRCDISYLRPITNLLWGYIQTEPDRLSLPRRAHEYLHFYGLRLEGAAVGPLQPADNRGTFLSAFHSVLNLAARFFAVSMNTTMQADAYPALHAIKELALVLEAGMQNQFWDLPLAARGEMLIQQFFFNRPEVRDFLNSRPNVTFPEPWMPQLDALRSMMGWNEASIRSYYDLANYGEQLLVSIRLWPWSTENNDQIAAAWLQAWRPEIQGYIHAYRAVTGVDLSANDQRYASQELFAVQPSDLIFRRRAALSGSTRF
jgi:hypothetical protein